MKVISGGQTGVDMAALRAAKGAGITTGGWAPRGFKTQSGPMLFLGDMYGLKEHASDTYKARTYSNVKDSDATLRIAYTFKSPGEICTLNAIHRFGRPHFDIQLPLSQPQVLVVDSIVKWLRINGVRVLNVTGNSEKTHPGLGEETFVLLRALFKYCNENRPITNEPF